MKPPTHHTLKATSAKALLELDPHRTVQRDAARWITGPQVDGHLTDSASRSKSSTSAGPHGSPTWISAAVDGPAPSAGCSRWPWRSWQVDQSRVDAPRTVLLHSST